ncbi:MAG: helix-turn-helix domain-containing protein [Patescibacteria group bacterium]|nr:helix-turn-helix domain-containing protein [Patescibacteria group bacterium]
MSFNGGFVMAKFQLKAKAHNLWANGESIKVIAKQLLVSPSTVSLWCKDIKLTPSQILELERRAKDPKYGKRLEYSLKQQQKRLEKTKKLFEEGKNEIGILNKRELFLTGVALYWAEGFKSDNLVGFCNSDPNMVKIFIHWLKSCFDYTEDDLRLRVGVNEEFREKIEEIENFWAECTGVKKEQFQKAFYQKVKWKKIYDHPEDYHGVLRIRVKKSTDFLRKIKGYIYGLSLTAR